MHDFHPTQSNVGSSYESYQRRLNPNGISNTQYQCTKINCPLCRVLVQRRSLNRHVRNAHGEAALLDLQTQAQPRTQTIQTLPSHSWTLDRASIACPHSSCPYRPTTNYDLREHLCRLHPRDTAVFTNITVEQCLNCGMYVTTGDTLENHPTTDFCKRHHNRNKLIIQNKTNSQTQQTIFHINNTALEQVTSFRYLGRSVGNKNDDWLAVSNNIHKAQVRWARIAKVLRQRTFSEQTATNLYKVLIQSILLYGAETWVLNTSMRDRLRLFHHKMA